MSCLFFYLTVELQSLLFALSLCLWGHWGTQNLLQSAHCQIGMLGHAFLTKAWGSFSEWKMASQKYLSQLDVVVHICHPSTWEDAGEPAASKFALAVWQLHGQPGLEICLKQKGFFLEHGFYLWMCVCFFLNNSLLRDWLRVLNACCENMTWVRVQIFTTYV